MKTLNFLDGDIALDSAGNLSTAEGAEGLRQKIESRLTLWLGDWFLNTTSGIPFLQNLIGRSTSGIAEQTAGAIISREVVKEPEVLSVKQSETQLDRRNRKFTYRAFVNTIYGVLNIEG